MLKSAEVAGGDDHHIYVYLHGFLSSEASFKGTALAAQFQDVVHLHLANLNCGPDPSSLTVPRALDAVTKIFEKAKAAAAPHISSILKLRLIGSSMGGWLSALYAAKFPDRVDRILMLCPAFCFADCLEAFVAGQLKEQPEGGATTLEERMANWKKDGVLEVVALHSGERCRVSYELYETTRASEDFPSYSCPAVIVQGTKDELVLPKMIVDFKTSGSVSAEQTSLAFVADDHYLVAPPSNALINWTFRSFFQVSAPRGKENSLPTEVEISDIPEAVAAIRDLDPSKKLSFRCFRTRNPTPTTGPSNYWWVEVDGLSKRLM